MAWKLEKDRKKTKRKTEEQKLQERKTRYIPEEDKRRGAELGMYVCISVMQYGVGDVGRWTQREHVCMHSDWSLGCGRILFDMPDISMLAWLGWEVIPRGNMGDNARKRQTPTQA